MRPLLSNSIQNALLRSSLTLMSDQWDEVISRSHERFMEFARNVESASAHQDLMHVTHLMLTSMVEAKRTTSIQKLIDEHDIRPRHLAILATAILTTVGEMLKDEWTVEIECVWDEALHNLVAHIIRSRAAVKR